MDYHQECRDTCINMNESLNIMSPPPKKKIKGSENITVQHDLYKDLI